MGNEREKILNTFIQFYVVNKYVRSGIILLNGFSDTLDYIKSIGNIVWMNDDDDTLPVDSGNVYVSTFHTHQLIRVYNWALENPHMKFVVGGPICSSYIKYTSELPSNFEITDLFVEEYFGIENFSYKWKLEVPDSAIKDSMNSMKKMFGDGYVKRIKEHNPPIWFSYTIDDRCYWSKCIFCSFKERTNRVRKNIDFEYKDINYKGVKTIELQSSALLPKLIVPVVENRPQGNDFWHRIFIRATKAELNELKKLNNIDNTIFVIGLEYPTKRMLNHMKKGYDPETVLEILHLTKNHHSLTGIIGWNNLTIQDVNELEEFMKKIPHTEIQSDFCLYSMFGVFGTKIHDEYEINEEHSYGPFYFGFHPKLNPEQLELNLKSRDIIIHYGKEKGYNMRFEGTCI